MEGMVAEAEHYVRRGYFSRAEVAAVLRRRQHFEYRLRRRNAVLADYLRCARAVTLRLGGEHAALCTSRPRAACALPGRRP